MLLELARPVGLQPTLRSEAESAPAHVSAASRTLLEGLLVRFGNKRCLRHQSRACRGLMEPQYDGREVSVASTRKLPT